MVSTGLEQFIDGFHSSVPFTIGSAELSFPYQIYQFAYEMEYQTASDTYHKLVKPHFSPVIRFLSSSVVLDVDYILIRDTLKDVYRDFIHSWRQLTTSDREILYPLKLSTELEYILRTDSPKEFTDQAISYLVPRKFSSNRLKMIKCYYLAKAHEQDDIGKAVSFYNRSLKHAVSKYWSIKIRNSRAILLGKLGEFNRAEKEFAELLSLTDELSLSHQRAQVFNNLAIISNMKENPVQAATYSNYTIELCRQFQFNRLHRKILHNKANVLFREGKFNDALTVYLMLLSCYSTTKDRKMVTRLHTTIGATHARMGNYLDAELNYEEALSNIEILDLYQQINLELNYSELQIQIGKFKQAEQCLDNVQPKVTISASQILEARYEMLRVKLGIYKSSLDLSWDKLEIISKYFAFESDHSGIASVNYYKAQIHEMMGDYYTAQQSLVEALQYASYLDHPVLKANYLYYQIYLLMFTSEHHQIHNYREELAQLVQDHNYGILYHYLTVADVMINVHLSLDFGFTDTNLTELEMMVELIDTETYINERLKEQFLTYVAKTIADLDFPEEMGAHFNHVMGILEGMTTVTNSNYTMSYLYLFQAKYEFKLGNIDDAGILFHHSRELALEGGYSKVIEELGAFEGEMSRVFA